jgi:hypothetical protein
VSSATTPPRRRNPVIVVVDIVVSVILLAFGLTFGAYSLAFVAQLSELSTGCGAGCNTTLLSVAAYGLLAVTVLGFFLGLGFAIVRAIRRRYTWPSPLIALVVMIAGFYVAAWIAGMGAPAA